MWRVTAVVLAAGVLFFGLFACGTPAPAASDEPGLEWKNIGSTVDGGGIYVACDKPRGVLLYWNRQRDSITAVHVPNTGC